MEPVAVRMGRFFGEDFSSAEDNGIRLEEVFELFPSFFEEVGPQTPKSSWEFVHEGNRGDVDELAKEGLEPFAVCRYDENLLSLGKKESDSPEQDKLVTHVLVPPEPDDEDFFAFDMELIADVHKSECPKT